METVAQSLGNLDGKIVIDVSMPFEQGDDGYPKHLLKYFERRDDPGLEPRRKSR